MKKYPCCFPAELPAGKMFSLPTARVAGQKASDRNGLRGGARIFSRVFPRGREKGASLASPPPLRYISPAVGGV
jgi:hypothetical protein